MDIGQVLLWINSVTPAALDEGVIDGATPTRVGVPEEQPSLLSNRRRPHVIFHKVVIDLKSTVSQVAHQRRVLVEEIVDRFAQAALR
jgi:hypothetical protein